MSESPEMVASTMDAFDRAILQVLQEDATLPLADIADRVGLSTSPCWRRIQRMKEEGLIDRQVVILNPARVGMSVLVFVQVKLSAHGRQNLAEFTEAACRIPEILECHPVIGDFDYILRVMAEDIKAYERLLTVEFSGLPGVQEIKSAMALSPIKSTTAIPLRRPG